MILEYQITQYTWKSYDTRIYTWNHTHVEIKMYTRIFNQQHTQVTRINDKHHLQVETILSANVYMNMIVHMLKS